MDVRKIFQNVIWSKRALRRILIGFGVFIGVLVVGFVVLYEVEWHWLTSGERRAAKAALVEIDLLQNARSMNGKEYDLQREKAQLKFNAARDVAQTFRDEETLAALSTYFIWTTSPWDQARFNLENPGFSTSDADLNTEVKRWISEVKLRKQMSSMLHKELD